MTNYFYLLMLPVIRLTKLLVKGPLLPKPTLYRPKYIGCQQDPDIFCKLSSPKGKLMIYSSPLACQAAKPAYFLCQQKNRH